MGLYFSVKINFVLKNYIFLAILPLTAAVYSVDLKHSVDLAVSGE